MVFLHSSLAYFPHCNGWKTYSSKMDLYSLEGLHCSYISFSLLNLLTFSFLWVSPYWQVECLVLLCPYNSRWQSHCPFSVSISYYTLPSDRLCTQDSPTLEFLYHLNSRTPSLSYWVKDQVCFLCSDISLLVFCEIVLLVNTVCFSVCLLWG